MDRNYGARGPSLQRRSSDLLILNLPIRNLAFQGLIHEIRSDFKTNLHFYWSAMMAVSEARQAYLVGMLKTLMCSQFMTSVVTITLKGHPRCHDVSVKNEPTELG